MIDTTKGPEEDYQHLFKSKLLSLYNNFIKIFLN